MNELLIIVSLLVLFSSVLLFLRFFGESGLCTITVFATIAANIEVLILIKAFSMEQTLGNILFASTFLCTDIASEIYGKKSANKIVSTGITTSILFVIVSQSWLLYTPIEEGVVTDSIRNIFSNTPRLMITSFLVYAVCQKFDVFMYHFVWQKTENYCKNKKKFLWVRNNMSTLTSQLLNSFLFNFGAFYGVFDVSTIINISISSYIIFAFLAIADTLFIYIARSMHEKNMIK